MQADELPGSFFTIQAPLSALRAPFSRTTISANAAFSLPDLDRGTTTGWALRTTRRHSPMASF